MAGPWPVGSYWWHWAEAMKGVFKRPYAKA